MKTFCGVMMIMSAIVGVSVLEDCGGACVPEDADGLWRWIVAIICVMSTIFFGLAAVTIGGYEDE